MNWYEPLKQMTKTAEELGHGNTLEGQYLKEERLRLFKAINHLRTIAAAGGPDGVLPRWRPEVRRSILLLPAATKTQNMSMFELRKVSTQIDGIRNFMTNYSTSRLKEIMGT